MKTYTLIVFLIFINTIYSQTFKSSSGNQVLTLNGKYATVKWLNRLDGVTTEYATYVGEIKEENYNVFNGSKYYISYSKYKVNGGEDYFLITPCTFLTTPIDNCWEIEYFNELDISNWGSSIEVRK
jgi:phosphoglucomutase